MTLDAPPDEDVDSALERELENDHLQKCARLWLEGVLNESFDPDKPLLEVLQDGEILLRVAKGLKATRSAGPEAARASFAKKGANSRSQKLSYLAYDNVEYFLNFCREVGLTDIHLFSPSDLVETKDARRVCVCLRTLSNMVKDVVKISFEDVEGLHKMRRRPSTKVGDILETFQPRRASEETTVITATTTVNGVAPEQDGLDAAARPHSVDSSEAADAGTPEIPPWAPVAAAAVAFLGIVLARRSGKKKRAVIVSEYEIQKGDTLIHISKRVGKANWEEIVELNPTIENPDLIYPKDKLKLS